jgi:hypothetical protein
MPRKKNNRKKIQAAKRKANAPKKTAPVATIGHISPTQPGMALAAALMMSQLAGPGSALQRNEDS